MRLAPGVPGGRSGLLEPEVFCLAMTRETRYRTCDGVTMERVT